MFRGRGRRGVRRGGRGPRQAQFDGMLSDVRCGAEGRVSCSVLIFFPCFNVSLNRKTYDSC